MATQWYRVFDDALRSSDVVAVHAVVDAYLGRAATRSEVTSARRAANTYAAASNVRVFHTPAVRDDGRHVRVLMLARADADLDETDRVHAIASGRPTLPRTRRRGPTGGPQGAESLLSAILKTADTARRLDVAQLDPNHARQLHDDLTSALRDLTTFQGRLRRRSQDHANHLGPNTGRRPIGPLSDKRSERAHTSTDR